jgi:hypothetical protein
LVVVSPIDTDMMRFSGRNGYSTTFIQQQAAEYEHYQNLRKGEAAGHQSAYRSREAPWSHNPWQATPLTPPDSGYGTPEYSLNSATTTTKPYEWFSQPTVQMPFNHGPNRYPQAQAQNAYYSRHGNYPGHYAYGQGMWEHNGLAECNCAGCSAVKQPPYFPVSHGYGQPVMG